MVLTGATLLETTTPDSYGRFGFYGLSDGDYVVQVRKVGYKSPPARAFHVENGSVSSTSGDNEFALEQVDSDTFVFHWEEDQSTAGYEYSSRVNEPITVEFVDEGTEVRDGSFANRLLHDYNIALVNDGGESWTHEHAYRLLRTMEAIPQQTRNPYEEQSLPASQWSIVSEHLENDIQIDRADGGGTSTVRVAADAFLNASPRIAMIDGRRGAYYSQKLHHAVVRFVTDNGQDVDAYEKILGERFGLTTQISEHTTYEALTANTTNEAASRFQAFHSEEIVQIINTLEEMPAGMRTIPGLSYIARRLDGTPHPTYGTAPAVAWVTQGYIEFMETAFNSSSELYMHRLILHEKAHFLWAHLFDEQLRQDWTQLGGWYADANDEDGWSTSKQTEFVSAYAHAVNPNEDMAESIAYFIVNPDKLKSRSIAKYEFLRDRIMQGNVYISQIRDDLTFEVYNLYPDYVFPGKIRRVDITVSGGPEEDKQVRIEIDLHAQDSVLEGAQKAYLRIFSEAGTFKDLRLYPVGVPRGTAGTLLAGAFTLSKHAKEGYWSPDQIQLTDEHGNERFEGINDFGWNLLVNNPLEDIVPARYMSNSASLSKAVETRDGQEVQLIEATWSVDENSGAMREIQPCYAALNDENLDTYSIEEYGEYDPATETCSVTFVMPHYMPSSVYTMSYIWMSDLARNFTGVYFGNPGHGLRPEQSIVDETALQIDLTTNNEDTSAPELDLNNIIIQATSTRPSDPNGETLVRLQVRVRDDIAGFTFGNFDLRDPQGVDHYYYIYGESRSSLFPPGDPSQWTAHTWAVILPAGSPPGIWGLAEMTVRDRAGNFSTHAFTEIIHFDVE